MVRPAALASSLPGHDVREDTTSVPRTGVLEVNGTFLSYEEQGAGQPVVLVHGALSDLRVWDPLRDELARRAEISGFRVIAYTQRYYGTREWSDDGTRFSVATHAEDLARLIATLAVEPVHIVGASYGGLVAATAAVRNPALVRSLILYEAIIMSVLPAESPEGKIAREDRAKMAGPYIAMAKAGDFTKAAKLVQEAVYQLSPGEFDSLPEDWQMVLLDNARVVPLLLAAPPPPAITCDMLKDFTRPTLVMRGEKTLKWYALISEAITKCVPGARKVILQNVNHDGPVRDPSAFSAAVFEFLSRCC